MSNLATTNQVPAAQPSEAGSLADELAKARRRILEHYERVYQLSHEVALAKVKEMGSKENLEFILQRPPTETSWWDLDQMAAHDPDLAAERWLEIKEAARQELTSGHRVAESVANSDEYAWKRAQFLALRDELSSEWSPRNGLEWTLIDMMAQAWTGQMIWMKKLVTLESIQTSESSSKTNVISPAALDQAAIMLDRFNRIFMRALRQLRDLRRYTVVIQGAGQVNIGEQQVNVVDHAADDRGVIPKS